MAIGNMTIEDMAELVSPGIKQIMADNEAMQKEIETLYARIKELYTVIEKLGIGKANKED